MLQLLETKDTISCKFTVTIVGPFETASIAFSPHKVACILAWVDVKRPLLYLQVATEWLYSVPAHIKESVQGREDPSTPIQDKEEALDERKHSMAPRRVALQVIFPDLYNFLGPKLRTHRALRTTVSLWNTHYCNSNSFSKQKEWSEAHTSWNTLYILEYTPPFFLHFPLRIQFFLSRNLAN